MTDWTYGALHSSITHSLATQRLSPHIGIYIDEHSSGAEFYYLISPHLNFIPTDQPSKVLHRARGLLMLLNSSLKLQKGYTPRLSTSDELYYSEGDLSSAFKIHHYPSLNSYPIETMVYPFDPAYKYEEESVVKNSVISKVFHFAFMEEIVCEVMYFFYHAINSDIHLIVESYRVWEHIKYDLEVNSAQDEENLPEEVKNEFQNFKKYKHFMNSWEGAGLYGRHGKSGQMFAKQQPSFEDIRNDLCNLVNAWINNKYNTLQ